MMGGATILSTQWLRCIILLVLPTAALPFCVSPTEKRHSFALTKLFSKGHQRDGDGDQSDDGTDDGFSFGLYVHIPYCRRRCNYCDFAIVPIGDAKTKNNHDGGHDGRDKSTTSTTTSGFETMDSNYKKAILDEIDVIRKTSTEKIRLKSIYFGGGTPSLAPLSTLKDILHAILGSETAPFYLEEDNDNTAEVTIEMDPGTFDMSYLTSIKEMGFNRISLGVQSFDDTLLTTMGRVHRSEDVYRSIDMIGQVFGDGEDDHANYSIDLISGVPGLTLAGWTETLQKAVQLNPRPNHMSVYDLQVEQGTTFGKWYNDVDVEDGGSLNRLQQQQGTQSTTSSSSSSQSEHHHPALPSPDDCAFMYSYASGYLRSKNYEHYEISSYAYRGKTNNGSSSSHSHSHRSKHNQIYWQYDGQWYSIGLGATSNVDGVRFARPRALSDYISWSEGLKQKYADYSPNENAHDDVSKPPWLYNKPEINDEGTDENENENDNDNLLDTLMTRLRTSEGLDLDWVAEHYGEQCVSSILNGFELALDLDLGEREFASGSNEKYGGIRLKDPKGFLFSNNIISNIFLEFE